MTKSNCPRRNTSKRFLFGETERIASRQDPLISSTTVTTLCKGVLSCRYCQGITENLAAALQIKPGGAA
ncbi:uncharacterized protein LMH87_008786 [Akanthomyces muscarius]|uniref:Uncharacterized protein n=1 Tax=Akanthomyces muscarius TaxID=2231603 RepID=A0A9W8QIQ9_AKAMU|nr:uncharacterized protein LMH87_008786 [Akanthomyces muscarius]KAJ4158253.1 hypothetical protein LMH87_008786 [Akanthomyces muscarius]